MDFTGVQLHPNWRSLATVQISLKRFIKEGTNEAQKGISKWNEKYEISGVQSDEIKEFYEDLTREENNQSKYSVKETGIKIISNKLKKTDFEVKRYFRSAMENKVDDLEKMHFEGQNINVCDHYGWSALMMASCEGAFEAVEFLLKLGVDKFIKSSTGITARTLALKKGHMDIVDLLEKGSIDVAEGKQNPIEKYDPYYCETCKQNFKESSRNQHNTSTLHQFNTKSNLKSNKLQKFNISTRNKGLQLMIKQGWDRESGLGPSQSGRLYPVKTVIRKQRTGLGIQQEAARVTHFEAFDCKSVQRHNSDYHKKKSRNRNDIRREKLRDWKRERRLRNELC